MIRIPTWSHSSELLESPYTLLLRLVMLSFSRLNKHKWEKIIYFQVELTTSFRREVYKNPAVCPLLTIFTGHSQSRAPPTVVATVVLNGRRNNDRRPCVDCTKFLGFWIFLPRASFHDMNRRSGKRDDFRHVAVESDFAAECKVSCFPFLYVSFMPSLLVVYILGLLSFYLTASLTLSNLMISYFFQGARSATKSVCPYGCGRVIARRTIEHHRTQGVRYLY